MSGFTFDFAINISEMLMTQPEQRRLLNWTSISSASFHMRLRNKMIQVSTRLEIFQTWVNGWQIFCLNEITSRLRIEYVCNLQHNIDNISLFLIVRAATFQTLLAPLIVEAGRTFSKIGQQIISDICSSDLAQFSAMRHCIHEEIKRGNWHHWRSQSSDFIIAGKKREKWKVTTGCLLRASPLSF